MEKEEELEDHQHHERRMLLELTWRYMTHTNTHGLWTLVFLCWREGITWTSHRKLVLAVTTSSTLLHKKGSAKGRTSWDWLCMMFRRPLAREASPQMWTEMSREQDRGASGRVQRHSVHGGPRRWLHWYKRRFLLLVESIERAKDWGFVAVWGFLLKMGFQISLISLCFSQEWAGVTSLQQVFPSSCWWSVRGAHVANFSIPRIAELYIFHTHHSCCMSSIANVEHESHLWGSVSTQPCS